LVLTTKKTLGDPQRKGIREIAVRLQHMGLEGNDWNHNFLKDHPTRFVCCGISPPATTKICQVFLGGQESCTNLAALAADSRAVRSRQ
jgi:hypothetical protein